MCRRLLDLYRTLHQTQHIRSPQRTRRLVHVVACRIRPQDGFVWVRRDPLLCDRDAPRTRSELEGIVLERTPLKLVVEELAHAVLAHRRSGRDLPPALQLVVELFQPGFDDDE